MTVQTPAGKAAHPTSRSSALTQQREKEAAAEEAFHAQAERLERFRAEVSARNAARHAEAKTKRDSACAAGAWAKLVETREHNEVGLPVLAEVCEPL